MPSSLANNELSGPLVLVGLFKKIQKWKKRNFTYQFLINPETIAHCVFYTVIINELEIILIAG